MKGSCSIVFPALAIILLTAALGTPSIPLETTLERGSRTEDLIIKFYPNIDEAYQALKNGDIDMLGYEITSSIYNNAVNDTNIVLAPVVDRGMYGFDINNNCTIPTYPGVRSPTNYKGFRQAIAYLVDKDYIVDDFCGGFAERIDQPISAGQKGWCNKSMWYPNYPYEYDPQAASDTLDSEGFLQGTTNNTYYDSTFPGSAQKIRVYPTGHSKAGDDLDDLRVYPRADDLRRWNAGNLLISNLRKHGIPVKVLSWYGFWWPPWLAEPDYHIYTGGWSIGRFPARTLYYLYHTDGWYINGPNIYTGFDCNGFPNYPKLDQLLYNASHPLTHEDEVKYTNQALGYFTEECIAIPLFSSKSYWAYSTDILGVVNNDLIGFENGYSFLNAYKIDGSPIRYGIKIPPIAMNKIYSQWFYDYQCLDRMDLYSGMETPPYDRSIDQPGYILDWTVGTWADPDDATNKTKNVQTYRDDAWFVEPVTGNQLEHINNTHHYASIWYEYQLSDAWNHRSVEDIKSLRIIDTDTIEIYWNLPSYWNTYKGATSIKSFNWYSKGNLSQTVTESLTADAISGYVSCAEPVFYVLNAESEGTPLVLGTDYDIYMDPDGPHNADVRIINHSYLGASVNITYLAAGDANGYYPGGLPWQDAFEGAGMYYAVDFVPGAGGYLTLKRNPFYPMETPPIGEVDFIKKGNGCYKIDIFDIVRGVNAYGSQGISIPDAHWFPGADLAYPGGQIDIFDIVTIATKYGTEWDCP